MNSEIKGESMKLLAASSRRYCFWKILLGFMCLLPASTAVLSDEAKTVRVVIDYNDGVEKHFNAIDWQAEMTVLDAMNAAKQHPRGITFESKGRGATTLLTKIDDRGNEGRGLNWLYKVNGKPGDRSIGVFELQAGDTVLWKFDKYK